MNSDAFELEAATAEQVYSNGEIQQLHDKIVDCMPLMTTDDVESLVALMENELKERDADFEQFIKDIPF